MTEKWTPETLKQYTDVQFQMLQRDIDRRVEAQDKVLRTRADRVDVLFDLVNIHLGRLDDAMAEVQGGRRTANRLWTLGIAGLAAISGVVAIIVYNLPHK